MRLSLNTNKSFVINLFTFICNNNMEVAYDALFVVLCTWLILLVGRRLYLNLCHYMAFPLVSVYVLAACIVLFVFRHYNCYYHD